MWPDRVSNPGPPTYESGALPIALRGPAQIQSKIGFFYSSLKGIQKKFLDLFNLYPVVTVNKVLYNL